MKLTTEAYRISMAQALREKSYVSIGFAFVNDDATEDGEWLTNGTASYTELTGVIDNPILNYRYTFATLELNRWTLDGTQTLLATSSEHANPGYVSSYISGEDGKFSTTPELRRAFDSTHDLEGFTLAFDDGAGEWPIAASVVFYDENNTAIYTADLAAMTGAWNIVAQEIEGVDSIRITASDVLPYHRLHIQTTAFGLAQKFGNKDITGLRKVDDIDPISRRLPEQTVEFSLIDYDGVYDPENPTGISKYLQGRGKLSVQFGYDVDGDGTAYWLQADLYNMTSRPVWRHGIATVTATKRLGIMTDIYKRGVYGDRMPYGSPPLYKTLYNMAEDVLRDAGITTGYVIDNALETIYSTGIMPKVTHAEALQMIAHAGCCRLRCDAGNDIYIEKISTSEYQQQRAHKNWIEIRVQDDSANNYYRCKLTGPNTEYTNAIQVLPTNITITSQPSDAYGDIGDSASFSVTANGVNSYQWEYSKDSGITWDNATSTGATTSTITFDGITDWRLGIVLRCKLMASDGSYVYTNSVRMRLNTEAYIYEEPEYMSANEGDTSSAKVIAEGAAYQWQVSTNSGESWGNVSTSGITGGTTEEMTILLNGGRTNYWYRCKISDSNGLYVYSKVIKVCTPDSVTIYRQPATTYSQLQTLAVLSVFATEVSKYQWEVSKDNRFTWSKISTDFRIDNSSITEKSLALDKTEQCKSVEVNIYNATPENLADQFVIEQGSLTTADGTEFAASNVIRSRPVYLEPGTYMIRSSKKMSARVYDDSNAYVQAESINTWQTTQMLIRLAVPRYIRLVFANSDDSDLTPADLTDLQVCGINELIRNGLYSDINTNLSVFESDNPYGSYSVIAQNSSLTFLSGYFQFARYAQFVFDNIPVPPSDPVVSIYAMPVVEEVVDVKTKVVEGAGAEDVEDNVLVTSATIANALKAQIGDYLTLRDTYTLDYRGNPELDAGDVIGIQTRYTADRDVLVLRHEITFNGALRGNLTVKGL